MADFLYNFTDDSAYVLQVTGIDKNNEYDLQGDYVEITHWQILPEPPKGSSYG